MLTRCFLCSFGHNIQWERRRNVVNPWQKSLRYERWQWSVITWTKIPTYILHLREGKETKVFGFSVNT